MSDVVVKASKRLAVQECAYLSDWYVGYSPRNDSHCAEGTWSEWVRLARLILAEDERRGMSNEPREDDGGEP